VSSSPIDRKQLVSFGLIMAAAFAVIALIRARLSGIDTFAIAFMAVAAFFAVLAFLAPPLLAPIHRWWMSLAEALGWINTRLILIVVYYLLVTPIGVVMRFFGRSPLAIDRKGKTYWTKPSPHSYGDKHFEKQF
jgi:hypothetical protein